MLLNERDAIGAAFDVSPPVPDGIDRVLEVDTLMAVFAAQRFHRVDELRREALREPVPFRGGVPEIIERSLRLELASALRVTEAAAGRLMAMAEALVDRYPALLGSLERARVTERHVDVFVDLLDPVPAPVREGLIARALEMAESLPVGSFRRHLRTLVDTALSPTLEQRHRAAVAERRVAIEPAPDGMAWLNALMPAVEARAVFDRITELAKVLVAQEGDARTLDQARADVVGDLLTDGHVPAHPAAARGIRAEIFVTVPALSLLDDAHALHADPPVVEGVGPIPLATARELCGTQPEWTRVLTHPETGMVLSVGRTRYRTPGPLRRLTRWRAGRCLGPGCQMPADRCEIDHNVAWEHGGRTELGNHAPFCTGHHTIKHHGGWSIRQLPGGAIEWTSPTGRVYTEHPTRVVPVFRPAPDDESAHAAPPF